jgi:hypothetical protein
MNAAAVGAVAWVDGDLNAGNSSLFARRFDGTQWEVGAQTFNPSTYNHVDAVVVAPTGTIHLFANESLFMRAAATGPWTVSAPAGPSLSLADDGFAGFDAQGNGFLVSDNQGNIVANRFIADPAGWLSTQLVSMEMTAHPIVAVDAQGGAIAICSRGLTLGASRYSRAAGWTALPAIATLLVNSTILRMAEATDGTGYFVAWLQTNGPVNDLYAVRDQGAGWTPPALVSDGDHSVASRPLLGADGQGNAFLLWLQGTAASSLDVVAARYVKAQGSWSSPVKLSTAPAAISTMPSLAVSAGGIAAAAWRTDAGAVLGARFR